MWGFLPAVLRGDSSSIHVFEQLADGAGDSFIGALPGQRLRRIRHGLATNHAMVEDRPE